MKTLFAAFAAALPLAAFAAAPLAIKVLPKTPLIEQGRDAQLVNFEFLIENTSDAPVELTGIELTARNDRGALVLQRRLQENGGSIGTLPERTIAPHAKLVVFNPFAALPADAKLSTLRYDFAAGDAHAFIDVKPRPYRTKTDLILPLRGRVFVHDGHDFLSHHRRLDVTGKMTTAIGIDTNMTRYAYDFVLIDEAGAMHRGSGEKNADWLCFGTPVYAPGDGVVVAAAPRDVADNEGESRFRPDMDELLENVLMIGGNFLVIDHGNGEFSFLAHMKSGSVTKKKGDRVKQGELVGAVGASGDAMFPHLHYQLQSDAYLGEGLPSYFRDAKRFDGETFVPARRIDTGDVVISSLAPRASVPAAP